MDKKDMVGNVPGDSSLGADDCMGLVGDLIAKLRAKPPVITREQLRMFLEKQNPFATPTRLCVNGSNPRWLTIWQADYCYINSNLTIQDFPIPDSSIRDVEYDVVTFDHEPTTREILVKLEEPGYRRPSRDESETYLDALPDSKADLGKSPVVALCGSVVGVHVAYVYADDDGRDLNRLMLDGRWSRACRFLRVRKSAL